MPSGKTHDRITIGAAVLTAPAYLLLAPPPVDVTAGLTLVGATLVSGLLLSPDLDLDSSVYRRWGPLRFLWWPYQKLIPHRSQLSHSYLLGPLLRVAYFVLVLWLLWRVGTWVASFFVSFDRNHLSRHYAEAVFDLWQTHPLHTQMALTGLLLGTALHVAADTLISRLRKRPFRGRRRR